MISNSHHPTPVESHGPQGTGPIVLVPLNGSATSAAALPYARLAAGLIGGTVHLLHVAVEPLVGTPLLTAMGLDPASIRGFVVRHATGSPADAVLRAASDDDARLIVMTSHGWTGDRRRPLGSVAEAVLVRSSCPVLLVPPRVHVPDTENEPALKRILLPLDGTPTTAAALEPAAALATANCADLDILHVIAGPEPTAGEAGALSLPRYVDQPHLAYRTWTREFQRRFCARFAGLTQQVRVAVGEPGVEVVRFARERASDLIVLAWKGELYHSRAKTVRQVLKDAPCPVLFVRTQPDPGIASSIGSSRGA